MFDLFPTFLSPFQTTTTKAQFFARQHNFELVEDTTAQLWNLYSDGTLVASDRTPENALQYITSKLRRK